MERNSRKAARFERMSKTLFKELGEAMVRVRAEGLDLMPAIRSLSAAEEVVKETLDVCDPVWAARQESAQTAYAAREAAGKGFDREAMARAREARKAQQAIPGTSGESRKRGRKRA